MQASLSLYEHTIVELHGNNLTSTILEWATENNITLIVMGAHVKPRQPLLGSRDFDPSHTLGKDAGEIYYAIMFFLSFSP